MAFRWYRTGLHKKLRAGLTGDCYMAVLSCIVFLTIEEMFFVIIEGAENRSCLEVRGEFPLRSLYLRERNQ